MDHKGIKVLALCGYFLLPDDFNGSYLDALKEYVKYRESNKLPVTPLIDSSTIFGEERMSEYWQEFLEIIGDGRRFNGAFFLGEYSNGEWQTF